MSDLIISHSIHDSANLRVQVARTKILIKPLVDAALAFCEDHEIDLLIARTPSDRLEISQDLTGLGALLCDTLVYYAIDTRKRPAPLVVAPGTRPYEPKDLQAIMDLSKIAFSPFGGHYHTDPHITPEQANNVYYDWARRSCTEPGEADHIIVAERRGVVAGYVTLKVYGDGDGEVVLGAVAPEWQGGGIYRTMIEEGIAWLATHGAPRVLISTPIHNRSVRRVWCRLGLEPLKEYHTFHLWFDR